MQRVKKYSKYASFSLIIVVLFLNLSFLSCKDYHENIDTYYITGSKENKDNFKLLFDLLDREEPGSEGEFAVVREIAASFIRLNDYDRLIHFLSARTINNPVDPYNSYYFLMIAYAFIQQESLPIAAMYFDLIVKNYPDFIINDESIHLVCLKRLITLSANPEQQVWYYHELISRFPDSIDLGATYFMLGQACEKTGDWDGSIQAYVNYLPYIGTTNIPGFPNADQYARHQVNYSMPNKDWTFESLPALREAIEEALDAGSAWQLSRYQARGNFFRRSWGDTEDNARMDDINLAEFMHNNRIRYAPSLDASSNASEAYLRTTGWSSYMSTWYLYFRKIYFPQDPEIHGRWEWAGIYYGEKF